MSWLQIVRRFFLEHKITVLLIIGIIIILAVGIILVSKFVPSNQTPVEITEEDLIFDPEGPYAILFPRRDGNAMNLNLKRTASYDKISYELAYSSEGIDRGVMGEINTKDKKGEYDQEILFGTCSKNVCKYDKDVENGTLTLHIQKGNKGYKMISQWHLQSPEIAKGILTSGDNHLTYTIDQGQDLTLIKYSITNDLSGAPKLPGDKKILGKVYAINSPEGKTISQGTITIELPENPPAGAKIARFDDGSNKWIELDTKIEGSKLMAKSTGGGSITVLTPAANP
jgi:hypothetical protein